MPSRISFNVTDANNSWSCPLHCHQCQYRITINRRCRNRVCFGSPLCWAHNKMVYGVKSKPSTIAGAGKGLFSTLGFPRNHWICPMVGESLTGECVDLRYPGDMTAPYAEDAEQLGFVDCACSRGIGSQANAKFHPNGRVRAQRLHNAVTLIRTEFDDGRPNPEPELWIKSTKQIAPGSEIFLWYGREYRLENNHTTRRRKSVADSRPCR